jgi:hypothetical protein
MLNEDNAFVSSSSMCVAASVTSSLVNKTGQFSHKYERVRAHASWGLIPAEMFPSPALSRSYPRTPGLSPRPGRAAAMELASPFSRLNGHVARLTLPRASATSATTSGEGVVLAKVMLTPRLGAADSPMIRPVLIGNCCLSRPSRWAGPGSALCKCASAQHEGRLPASWAADQCPGRRVMIQPTPGLGAGE